MNFEEKFFPEPNSGCWIWMHSVDKDGYGKHNGQRANRYSYAKYKGDPGDAHVLHKCDNPYCVNPDHLFLGTHADNMKDRSRKGRNNNPTKFSPTVLKEIASFSGHYKDAIRIFGVSRAHYYRLRTKNTLT